MAGTPGARESGGLDAKDVARDGLSDEQAERVLWLVLYHQHYASRGDHTAIEVLVQSDGTPPYPGYVAFGASSDSSDEGATYQKGRFVVSRATADVWELFQCRRQTFARLRKIQAKVSEQTGRRFRDEKAQRRGLGCTEE